MNEKSNFRSMIKVFLRWVDLFKWRIIIAVLLISISVLLATEPAWFISAIDALRIPYAVFLVGLIVFFFIRGNNMLTSASVIALLILAPDIWPYFKTSGETPAETKAQKREIVKTDFSVLHFNVKEKNKNILSVAETAIQSDADMISLQELHASSLAAIDTVLRKKYPFVLSDVSIKGFGMAVYSKYPIDSGEARKQNDYVFLTGIIKVKDRMFRFISATTSTPTNEKDYSNQIKQFKFLTDYINSVDSAIIVMGDMNSVPWSEQIKTFMEYTQLADSRKDLSATYPAQSPFQIPIDYIFHSPELDCKKFTTVGGSTSNHLGLIGYYNFRNTGKKDKLNFKDMVN